MQYVYLQNNLVENHGKHVIPQFWRDIVAFIDNFTTCEITKLLWQRTIFDSAKMASKFK